MLASSSSFYWCMRTYADVCGRMLIPTDCTRYRQVAYADVCWRMLMHAYTYRLCPSCDQIAKVWTFSTQASPHNEDFFPQIPKSGIVVKFFFLRLKSWRPPKVRVYTARSSIFFCTGFLLYWQVPEWLLNNKKVLEKGVGGLNKALLAGISRRRLLAAISSMACLITPVEALLRLCLLRLHRGSFKALLRIY